MKKICKIIYILIILITIMFIPCNVNAKSDIWSIGKDFINTGVQKDGMTAETKTIFEKLGLDTKEGFAELIDFLWGIGLLVIFISTVVLGIKYMLVLPGEKSRLKQATTPYIIGVVIIFGALTIWKFIIMILDGNL